MKTAQLTDNWKLETGNSSGQALLIVLLVLAVALTVVLSVVSRSITDVAITSKEEEASRAFSAAEAGIEQALITEASASGVPIGEAQYSVTVATLAEGEKNFPYPDRVYAGDAAVVWFVSHADDGSLTCTDGKCFKGKEVLICWGDRDLTTDPDVPDESWPALEVVALYTSEAGKYSTAKVGRAAYDENASRRSSNNFAAAGAVGNCSIAGQNYEFRQTVHLINDLGLPSGANGVSQKVNILQVMHLRLLYNDTPQPVGVTITDGSNLPAQGKKIESVGTAGQSSRKVEVFQLYSDLPPVFDFAVFSRSGGISK